MLRMKDTERRTLRSNKFRKSRRDSKKAKCKDTSLITEQPLRSQTTQLSLRLLMRSKSSMLKQRSSIKKLRLRDKRLRGHTREVDVEATEVNLLTEVELHGEATMKVEEVATVEATTQASEVTEEDIIREMKMPHSKRDRRFQVDTRVQEIPTVEVSEEAEVVIAEVVVAISKIRITQGRLQVTLKISSLANSLNTEEEVVSEATTVEDTAVEPRVERALILEMRATNITKESCRDSSQKVQQPPKATRKDSRK